MSENNPSRKILIIDDDPLAVKLASSLLSSSGYEVLVANDAPAGLEKAMTESPDLIVMDVMMPIINGFNICRLMKSQDKHCHIPIILLTSRASEDDKRIGEEVGADAYISKPFNTEQFIAKVKELLPA
ncbi:MAG: response regulator [Candidatus Omnitrophica bacterium]|nr:response regulator [Candidatus Omnitrophota bacterium]